MLIPVTNIIIRASNNACSTKVQPEYYAKAYQILWRRKLLDTDGITISPLPEDCPDALRYVYVASVEQEERNVINFFAGNDSNGSDASASTQRAQELFRLAFPDGLREEIRALLAKDAERAVAWSAKAGSRPSRPHPSLVEAGCSADEALALQGAGFSTLADVGDDIMSLVAVDGITPLRAAKLIASRRASEVAPPTAKNPLAAKG